MKNRIKFFVEGIFLLIISVNLVVAACTTDTIGKNLELKFGGIAQGMAQQVVINSIPGAGQAWQAVQIAQCFAGGVATCAMSIGLGQLESAAWSEVGKHIGGEATQVLQNVKDICGSAKDVEIDGETGEIKKGEITINNERTDVGKKVFGLDDGQISFDNAKITVDEKNPDVKVIETTDVSKMDFTKYGIQNVQFSKGTKITLRTSKKQEGSQDYSIERIQDEVTNFNGGLAGFKIAKGKGKVAFIGKGAELASGQKSNKDFLTIQGAEAITFKDPLSGKEIKHEYLSFAIYEDSQDGTAYSFYPKKKPWHKGGGFAAYEHGDSKIKPVSEDIVRWDSKTNILKVSAPEEVEVPAWKIFSPKNVKYSVDWWKYQAGMGPVPQIPMQESYSRASVTYSGVSEDWQEGIFVRGASDIEYNKNTKNPTSFEAGSGTGWVNSNKKLGKSDVLMTGEDRMKVFLDREGVSTGKSYEELVDLAQAGDKPSLVISVSSKGETTVPKYAAWGNGKEADFYIANEKTAARVFGSDINGFNGFVEDDMIRYNTGASTDIQVQTAIKDRELRYFAKATKTQVGKQEPQFTQREAPEEVNRDIFVARNTKSGFTYDTPPDDIPKQFDNLYSVRDENGNIIGVSARNFAETKIVKDSLVDTQFKSFAGQDPFVKQAGINAAQLSAKDYVKQNFAGYTDAWKLKRELIAEYNTQLAIAKNENLLMSQRVAANVAMANVKKALLQRDELLVKYSSWK